MKYEDNKDRMIPVKLDAVRVMQDPETGEFFYDICYECDKMLNEEEAAYSAESIELESWNEVDSSWELIDITRVSHLVLFLSLDV